MIFSRGDLPYKKFIASNAEIFGTMMNGKHNSFLCVGFESVSFVIS